MLTRRSDTVGPLHAPRRPAPRDRGRDPDPRPDGRSSARDILPEAPLDATVGQLATRDIVAPRALDFDERRPDRRGAPAAAERRPAASTTSPPRTRSPSRPPSSSPSRTRCRPDRHDVLGRPQRRGPRVAARDGRPGLTRQRARRRWSGSTPRAGRRSGPRPRGSSTRRCGRSCATRRSPSAAASLAGLMAGGLDEAERMLAAELISPLVVPNSTFSAELTERGQGARPPTRSSRSRSRSARARSSSATGRR